MSWPGYVFIALLTAANVAASFRLGRTAFGIKVELPRRAGRKSGGAA